MSGNEIRCHIDDDTNITNTLLKQLLSHIVTKRQLTVSLQRVCYFRIRMTSYRLC